MGHTNFNMRLDDALRARAYPVIEQYELTPSQAVRMFLNQIAETGKIPLSFDWAADQLSTTAMQALEQNQAEQARGTSTKFTSLKDLMSSLEK